MQFAKSCDEIVCESFQFCLTDRPASNLSSVEEAEKFTHTQKAATEKSKKKFSLKRRLSRTQSKIEKLAQRPLNGGKLDEAWGMKVLISKNLLLCKHLRRGQTWLSLLTLHRQHETEKNAEKEENFSFAESREYSQTSC